MIIDAIAIVLIVAGIGFLAVSAVGVVHLPTFLARAHAVAKSETLGIMLTILGLIVHHRFAAGSLQLLIVMAIAMIANPTAVHALARAAAIRAADPTAGDQPPVPEEAP